MLPEGASQVTCQETITRVELLEGKVSRFLGMRPGLPTSTINGALEGSRTGSELDIPLFKGDPFLQQVLDRLSWFCRHQQEAKAPFADQIAAVAKAKVDNSKKAGEETPSSADAQLACSSSNSGLDIFKEEATAAQLVRSSSNSGPYIFKVETTV